MAADAGVLLVLAMNHGERVPADEALDAAFDDTIAGIGDLFIFTNGVDVRRVELEGDIDAGKARAGSEGLQDLAGAGGAFLVHDLVEGFEPLRDLIDVRLRREYGFG